MDVKKVSYKSFHLQRGNAMHNYDLSPSQRPNPELDGLEPSRFPLLDDELAFFEEKSPTSWSIAAVSPAATIGGVPL